MHAVNKRDVCISPSADQMLDEKKTEIQNPKPKMAEKRCAKNLLFNSM